MVSMARRPGLRNRNHDSPVPDLSPHSRRALPPDLLVTRAAAADGWDLRRFDWPATAPRGGLFFQAGRGDIFEKYLESLGHWHARGWSLAGFDWRGHGGSGRIDHRAGLAAEFAPSVADLAAQWSAWTATTPRPHVLAAHSMGGYLALRAVLEGAVAPQALVFVAPMWGVRSPLGSALSGAVARWQCRRGDPGRAIWPEGAHPGGRLGRMALLTHDAERFADELWWHDRLPGHRLGAPSWAWLAEAFVATRALAADPRLSQMRVPALVLVAERDRLVDPRAALRVAARLAQAEVIRFGRDTAHEILREADPVRSRALAAIDAFLDRL